MQHKYNIIHILSAQHQNTIPWIYFCINACNTIPHNILRRVRKIAAIPKNVELTLIL